NILARVGAHHVVAPEHDMGERVAHLLTGRMLDYLEVDEDFAVVKTGPPRDIVGLALRDAAARDRYGVTVVAIRPAATEPGRRSAFRDATPDTMIMPDDIVIAIGSTDAVERFAAGD